MTSVELDTRMAGSEDGGSAKKTRQRSKVARIIREYELTGMDEELEAAESDDVIILHKQAYQLGFELCRLEWDARLVQAIGDFV